jgi:riboflavin kinase
MFVDDKGTIHLTDLSFAQVCADKYGVNRGVYNTIDEWFYNQGLQNILERRKNVLSFLEFIKGKSEFKTSRCKFGNGGLTIKLQEFYSYRFESILTKSASNL